jgi:Beta-propeller repeat
MSAHNRRGARLAAMLLSLAFSATPLRAHAQATSATRAWNTYLGGSGQDRVTSVVQDPANGNVVVGGWTQSNDFPPGRGTGTSTTKDAFVFVLNSSGGNVGLPVVFGGTGQDQVNAVAIGDQGQVYAVGSTQTTGMPGFAMYGGISGSNAAFLASFNAAGSPQWIMYLDGPGSESAMGVTVVGKDVYVTGETNDCRFLGRSSCTTALQEGFVVKVDTRPATPMVLWNTLLPGNLDEILTQSVVDGSTLVVAGTTSSTSFTLPQGVVKNFSQGQDDAVAAGLDASSGTVTWVQFMGGPEHDTGAGIVAANGEIVVAGTLGTTTQGTNVFATWMNSAGQRHRTETRGGDQDEFVSSVAIDSSGNVYIGGRTGSQGFPLSWAFDSTMEVTPPSQEGLVVVLPAQVGPGWSSFVGGSGSDNVLALSIRGKSLVMAGETSSSAELLVGGGYDTSFGGQLDGFIVAVNTDITPPEPGTVNDRPQSDAVPVDISTQTSLDSISANWDGFTDTETGVPRYEWAIGFSPGAANVWPFTPTSISGQRSFTQTGLTLIAGRTYYTTVRAINGAGLVSTVSSNGVTAGPVVTDGGTADGGTDGGTADGGTDGGTDGGVDGGTNGGTDGGTDEEPEEGNAPLMGWSCTAADAGLPMLAGLLALMLLTRRRGSQSR